MSWNCCRHMTHTYNSSCIILYTTIRHKHPPDHLEGNKYHLWTSDSNQKPLVITTQESHQAMMQQALQCSLILDSEKLWISAARVFDVWNKFFLIGAVCALLLTKRIQKVHNSEVRMNSSQSWSFRIWSSIVPYNIQKGTTEF